MKRSLDQLVGIARKATDIGTDLMMRTRPRNVIEKSDRDTFTDVDVRIEQEIRTYLADVTPEIGFIGEEEVDRNDTMDNSYVWMLDPIDGTANFTHNIPLCAVSLALINERMPIVAAVSLPYLNLHYFAMSGGGAFVNDNCIYTSKTREIAKAMVSIGDYATGDRANEKNKDRIMMTAAIAEKVERVRMFGSAAHDLAWLAEGRIDATVIMSNNTLDVAAGVLIAREAGAIITDIYGREYSFESQNMLAVTPGLSEAMLSIASKYTMDTRN